jgi:AcrR family transcriptional regulator
VPEVPGLVETSDRSTASRAAILAAAKRLFSTRGYAGTSVADIVQEAGTSVGLPYYHFGNKSSIFVAIWADYQEAQQRRTSAAIAEARRSGLTGTELLLVGIRAYLQGAWENRDILPIAHGPERPAGFDETFLRGAEQWNRQMLGLLSGHDSTLSRVALLMLTEALSGVCMKLAGSRSEEQARRTIDDTLQLTGSLLVAVPRNRQKGS